MLGSLSWDTAQSMQAWKRNFTPYGNYSNVVFGFMTLANFFHKELTKRSNNSIMTFCLDNVLNFGKWQINLETSKYLKRVR